MKISDSKKSETKLLVFDLFGVLISEGHLISNGLMRLLPENTDKLLVKQNYEKFNVGEINEAEFWSNIGHADNQKLRTDFLNLFELDPDFDVVKRLIKLFRLSILSNFPPDWAEEISKKFRFDQYFDPIVFSGFVACKKPNRKIYQHLIDKSEFDATQMVFIDDRLENLKTAHDLGMRTVFYHREDDKFPFNPDFVVSELSQVASLKL